MAFRLRLRLIHVLLRVLVDEELRQSANRVFDLVAKGVLKIRINQRYPLADIAQAHADLESGRTSGSSIIIP